MLKEIWEDKDTIVIGLPDEEAIEIAKEILKLCGKGE